MAEILAAKMLLVTRLSHLLCPLGGPPYDEGVVLLSEMNIYGHAARVCGALAKYSPQMECMSHCVFHYGCQPS